MQKKNLIFEAYFSGPRFESKYLIFLVFSQCPIPDIQFLRVSGSHPKNRLISVVLGSSPNKGLNELLILRLHFL